ncbi:hypothetical protein M5K25_015220 [Dendrobium thyrsiflorum]
MEEQMRLYIRLAMEDSGFHLHTSMDNNMYNLINVTRFPSFDTSARMRLCVTQHEHELRKKRNLPTSHGKHLLHYSLSQGSGSSQEEKEEKQGEKESRGIPALEKKEKASGVLRLWHSTGDESGKAR